MKKAISLINYPLPFIKEKGYIKITVEYYHGKPILFNCSKQIMNMKFIETTDVSITKLVK